MTKNDLKKWGRNEITLAIENKSDEEANYYWGAYFAYCDFYDRLNNLSDMGMVRPIFEQLIDKYPLTPIEGVDEDWIITEGYDPIPKGNDSGWTIYSCKRRPNLFKKVTYDRKTGVVEEVKYTDCDRSVCIDVNTGRMYVGGVGSVILDEMVPIAFPYSPNAKIKIFTENFKVYDGDSNFDTFGVLYFRLTDGSIKEVKRFFKENHKTHQLEEIGKTEYFARKKKYEDRSSK